MDKKIIGNLVGPASPQTKVDTELDINSNNAIANKVVAKIVTRITETEEKFGDLETTVMQNEEACRETAEKVGDIDTALDRIIEIQNSLIGGDA